MRLRGRRRGRASHEAAAAGEGHAMLRVFSWEFSTDTWDIIPGGLRSGSHLLQPPPMHVCMEAGTQKKKNIRSGSYDAPLHPELPALLPSASVPCPTPPLLISRAPSSTFA